MRIGIEKGERIPETVEVISSKSYVHRLLIAAAMSKTRTGVVTNAVSKDMEATVRCLRALGADIEVSESNGKHVFEIMKPIGAVKEALLDCGESGSTARFLLPVATALADKAEITGSGKLPERPFGPLCEALRENGIEADSDYLPIRVCGELKPGEYAIPGNVSSQYISGLMFALALLHENSIICLKSPLESEAYVNMTIEVLDVFGIKISRDENRFLIHGNSDIKGPNTVYAEGDWSNGGFLMCLGALNGGIELKGLRLPSIQGDSSVFEILKKFGYSVGCRGIGEESVVSISGTAVSVVDMDVSQIPDLVPALAAVAAFAPGESVFRNAERLRIKESDRIEAIVESLKLFGKESRIENVEGHENIHIFGGETAASNGEIHADGYNDHRIVMMLSILAVGSNRKVVIEGAEAVNKSYPGFFEVCERIGNHVLKEEN